MAPADATRDLGAVGPVVFCPPRQASGPLADSQIVVRRNSHSIEIARFPCVTSGEVLMDQDLSISGEHTLASYEGTESRRMSDAGLLLCDEDQSDR